MRAGKTILILLVLLAGFMVGQVLPSGLRAQVGAGPDDGEDGPPMAVVPLAALKTAGGRADLDPSELADIDVFRRTSPSVVNITTKALRRDWFMNVQEVPQGSGSGFVWDRQGHIVTNFHVIEESSQLLVTLSDQSEWEAEVVGYAPGKDLAVLRINAPAGRLVPLETGSSAELLVGQRVLALGNPFGLDHSLSTGVVSALGRELATRGTRATPEGRTVRDVIQTDAAINPGNSGGPLLDSRGRVVGVNTAIFSPSGASAGIGFAIPIDTVSRLVPQLIEHGRPIRPGLGISVVSDRVSRRYGIEGIVVETVSAGGPADRVGLEGLRRTRRGEVALGDRIIAVDGEPVETLDDMLHRFESAGVGHEVTLTVVRDGKSREVRVQLTRLE